MKKTLLTLGLVLVASITLHAQSILTATKPDAEVRAESVITGIQGTKRAMLGELRHNVDTVWSAPDSQAVITALGTKAGEAFWLSSQLATFLTTIMTAGNDTAGLAELQSILSKVKPVTVHEDGTVTIDPEPTPEP